MTLLPIILLIEYYSPAFHLLDKLINLKYEYNSYTGDERWAIITELSVKELWEKYPLVIERYSPFVHLSIAQGEVIEMRTSMQREAVAHLFRHIVKQFVLQYAVRRSEHRLTVLS